MDESPTLLTRRQFIKLTGATGAAAILGGGLTAFAPAPTYAAPEEEGILYGVCDVCTMGCAFIAHLSNGRIVRLSGNPKDQIAQGKMCVRGYSGIRLLYDPDRLKYPMKRTNPEKGVGVDPGWVKITWDEAFDLIATRFNQVRDQYGPQSIVIVARPQTWPKHFAYSIGTPNLISHNYTFAVSPERWGGQIKAEERAFAEMGSREHPRGLRALFQAIIRRMASNSD